jgi:hypothetical protein
MTFNRPGLLTTILIVIGIALKSLSRALELAGDLASDPGARLSNHIAALAALLAAAACFIWALKRIFFDKPREKPAADVADQTPRYVDIYPAETSFDPDAAFERYMTGRGHTGPGDPPPPKPGGFGRKGL